MSSNDNLKDIKADKLNLKPFRIFLSYLKPHTFKIFISILLIGIVTFIQILSPIMVMISVDDIIKNDDVSIGIYENYSDITGIKYGDKFYSTVTHNYKKPNSIARMVKYDDKYFFVQKGVMLDKSSIRISTDGKYYVKINGKHIFLNDADENFVNALRDKNRKNLYYIMIGFGILLIFYFIFGYLNTVVRNKIGQEIVYGLRMKVFNHLLFMNMGYFEKNPTGRLVTRTTNDIKNIHLMFTGVIMNSIKDLVLVSAIVVTMFNIDFKLTIVTLSLLPLYIILLLFYKTKAIKLQRKLKIKIANINSKLSEYITGIKQIQIFTVEKEYLDEFDEINRKYKNVRQKEVKLDSFFIAFLGFILNVTPIIILYYAYNKVYDRVLELGVVLAFIRYSNDFYRPLTQFAERFQILQSAMASIERLLIIFDAKPTIVDTKKAVDLEAIKSGISFKNVYFSYLKTDSKKYVLENINLNIKSGETTALVGHTGSGKTTIVNLINRLYDIDEGSILIDNNSIKSYKVASIRKKISVVLQDTFLFSDSVFENIRMYNKNISLDDVKRAAKIVNADKVIENLDGGYDYVFKENGRELSEGERQLISFARAVVVNPNILILDEATSSIDSKTEKLIQSAIETIKQSTTLIVIAHRLSTVKNADKIVVLNDGKIVEQGNHNELISLDGLYSKLYNLDFIG
ncbi:MAG: antibiotic ABC transporter ATP-binding protein [Clostridiales bacterium]|nr:MAG: antibiotic ABC transporter ATP-binding protein [Clostridiales bacterium]